MFILGLKFWTAPIYSAYASKMNTFSVPFAMIPMFFSNHIDLSLMSGIVMIMNAYVFWYHVDPPEEFRVTNKRYTKYRSSMHGGRGHSSDSDD